MRLLFTLLALLMPLAAANRADLGGLRQQIRQTLHVPERLPALGDKRYGQFPAAPGVDADRVAFTSDYSMRVPAIVYHQPGATIIKHPALIIINDQGGDKSSWYAWSAGIVYARAGAVVLTYDSPGEFERNKERRSATNQGGEKFSQPQMALRLYGLMVTDVLQAAKYLASRKDVDGDLIGVASFSKGSFIASAVCALDPHIRACAISGGAETWILPEQASAFPAMTEKRLDTAAWDATSQGPDFLMRPAARWLNDKLKFPGWTKKQVDSLQETAKPADFPAVPRDQLHAVPDAIWSADQENFIFETWVDRARHAIEAGAP